MDRVVAIDKIACRVVNCLLHQETNWLQWVSVFTTEAN